MIDWWIRKNMKWGCDIFQRTLVAFAWRDWRITQSVTRPGLWVEFRTLSPRSKSKRSAVSVLHIVVIWFWTDMKNSLIPKEPRWLSRYSNWLRAGRSDDRGSNPGDGWEFFLRHHFQTGSEAHPASYPVVNSVCLPGGKLAGEWSWPLTSI
jgi:hypothetical protein